MFEIQKLKETVYKQVEQSGMFKNMQAQLKSQVFSIIQSQTQDKKNRLGFSYEHPLLSKLMKYDKSIASKPISCYLLGFDPRVFGKLQVLIHTQRIPQISNLEIKQLNRTQKISREDLANRIGVKNAPHQAVLLTMVGPGYEKKAAPQSTKPASTIPSFSKEPASKQTIKVPANPPPHKQQPKPQPPPQQPKKKKPTTIPSTAPPEVKVTKQQKKTAEDFLRGILSKAPPPPENKPHERAASAPPVMVKKQPPPESGVNKIRGGVSTTKASPFSSLLGLATTSKDGGAKDPYAYDLKGGSPFGKKNQEVDEELDEFQNSQNSSYSRKNPLYSSTQNSGVYDQSANSVDIEDYDYYESVRRKKR